MNIIELLTKHIESHIEKEYADDKCKPEFIISELDKELMLTVTHLGSSYSSKIWSRSHIGDKFDNLYNATM